MNNPEVPPMTMRATSSSDKKLTGFCVNLGAIRLQISFNQPIDVPLDFGYALNIETNSKFSILQN
jgi:hypothetical protein